MAIYSLNFFVLVHAIYTSITIIHRFFNCTYRIDHTFSYSTMCKRGLVMYINLPIKRVCPANNNDDRWYLKYAKLVILKSDNDD